MPRIKNSPQKQASRRAWDRTIKPIIAEAKKRRGFIAEVCRQLEKIIHRPVNRQQIDEYMNPDKTKRVEPSGGMMLNLLAAVEAARKAMNARCD